MLLTYFTRFPRQLAYPENLAWYGFGPGHFFFAACFSGQVQVGQVPFFQFACLVGQVGVGQVRSLSFVAYILYTFSASASLPRKFSLV